MTTRNPTQETEPCEETLVDQTVPADDVIQNVEVPYKNMPGGVTQVNAIMSHPDSGRSVRRMVVRDAEDEVVHDTEIGLVGSEEVYRIDRGWAEYCDSPGAVYIPAVDETMPVDDYAELVGFDDPSWRLGIGFNESMREANGMSPW